MKSTSHGHRRARASGRRGRTPRPSARRSGAGRGPRSRARSPRRARHAVRQLVGLDEDLADAGSAIDGPRVRDPIRGGLSRQLRLPTSPRRSTSAAASPARTARRRSTSGAGSSSTIRTSRCSSRTKRSSTAWASEGRPTCRRGRPPRPERRWRSRWQPRRCAAEDRRASRLVGEQCLLEHAEARAGADVGPDREANSVVEVGRIGKMPLPRKALLVGQCATLARPPRGAAELARQSAPDGGRATVESLVGRRSSDPRYSPGTSRRRPARQVGDVTPVEVGVEGAIESGPRADSANRPDTDVRQAARGRPAPSCARSSRLAVVARPRCGGCDPRPRGDRDPQRQRARD